jgi:chemotaxis methyl-accepting protein methylase
VRFGRPKKAVPEDFDELIHTWKSKETSLEEVLKTCQMSESTFFRKLRTRSLHER